MSVYENTTVLKPHSMVQHWLTVLRNCEVGPEPKRNALNRLSHMLLVAATENAPHDESTITTPTGDATTGCTVRRIVAVFILRAALGMLSAVNEFLPFVSHAMVLVQRDEETGAPNPEHSYIKFPHIEHDSLILVGDPMLATGGSMSHTVGIVKSEIEQSEATGVTITAVCVIAAPEGLERMQRDHPDVHIIVAAVDGELDAKWYIRKPGAGDLGDEVMGTKRSK